VFHTHGLAVLVLMSAMPIAMVALLTLPEPAGRTLEDISGEAEHA
jgi:hypothetical protein